MRRNLRAPTSSVAKRSSGNSCTDVGAVYTAIWPTACWTPATRPVCSPRPRSLRAARSISDSDPARPGAADLSAVVLNVTVTAPTASGFLTVYPDGESMPNASNINFAAHQSVPNLVTVPVINGSVRFHNSSAGTVHIVADLEGYYSGTGNGFKPLAPLRVLDTRKSIGVTTTTTAPVTPLQMRSSFRSRKARSRSTTTVSVRPT